MLTLRTIFFSSHNILLAASLLVGVFAILVSIFAITSGRWIHVFRSFPVEAEMVSARADPLSPPTLQQVEPERQRNVSEEHYQGTAAIHFTAGCPEEHGRTGHRCGTTAADRGRDCPDEAYAGLWRVCLVYHCLNGSGAGSGGAAVCRQCSTANDPAFKRRPLCHVTTTVLAISPEAHKTLVVYILASAILVCGISLGVAGSCCGSFYLILGAFFNTTAGLLQFLGMFLFATGVSDALGDSQVQPGYNYDWGSINAVIAFAATNLTAILAAYSYRGRHQLDQKKKASSSLPEASMDLAKAYEQS